MPEMDPPKGMITRQLAVQVLQREGIIQSASMLNKLKGIGYFVPSGRKHGFYNENDLLTLINQRRKEHNKKQLKSLYERDLQFRQATAEDMQGVYEVALALFGHTTPASDRIPLLEKCPEGNVVVTDKGMVVSYAHLYPLKQETLRQFLAGKIRGPQITANGLDPFETGKVVDILVKSMGSYHLHKTTAKLYSKALFLGLSRELVRWAQKGYIIHRVYATSETFEGIQAAAEFMMQSRGRVPSTKGKIRYGYELDPLTSQLPMAQRYRQALEGWAKEHPEEYDRAWQTWREQNPQEL